MKEVRLNKTKQTMIFVIFGILILMSYMNSNSGVEIQSNFLNDILNDLGVDVEVSMATTYLLIGTISLLLMFYFFGVK